MSKKLADLCVISSKYTDSNGNEKCKYENIGVKMVSEDGKEFILLKPFINLAGFKSEGTGVLVSVFPVPKDSYSGQLSPNPPTEHCSNSTGTGQEFDIF